MFNINWMIYLFSFIRSTNTFYVSCILGNCNCFFNSGETFYIQGALLLYITSKMKLTGMHHYYDRM